MPFGTRAPSREKRFGSRRNSTTSWNSSRTSSTPATSSQVTDDFDEGSIVCGLTLGMMASVRQTRYTRKPKKTSGSQVSTPSLNESKKLATSIHPSIGQIPAKL